MQLKHWKPSSGKTTFTWEDKLLLRWVTEHNHHCSNLYQAIFFLYPFLYPFCILFCIVYCEIALILTCYLTFKLFQSRRTSLRKKVMLSGHMNCRWNNGSSTLNLLSLTNTFSCLRANLWSGVPLKCTYSSHAIWLVKKDFLWNDQLACPMVKVIPTSHKRSSHMGHTQFLMEIHFSMSQFSGKTFSEVVSPLVENIWETNSKEKLRVWAVFTQCLQLCNINTCHRVFYSFWCLKKIGKQLFVRGNNCQLHYNAKKQAAWPNWKICIWESQTSPRPICDFTTWRKHEIRFTENSGRRANRRVCVRSSPW